MCYKVVGIITLERAYLTIRRSSVLQVRGHEPHTEECPDGTLHPVSGGVLY